jgi:multimeric flavodoxin WrbA
MIRILAIYGSPRRNQNSDILLDKVLEGIGKVDTQVVKIYASSPDINHCTACSRCYKEGVCIIKDEMQQIYKEMDRADIVITSTPVHFHTVTSHLKKLIDRCQAVWASKFINKNTIIEKRPRLGYVICTGGPAEENTYFDCTIKVLDLFHKCINAKIAGQMTVANVDKEHVKDREAVLKEAIREGKKLKKTIDEVKKL